MKHLPLAVKMTVDYGVTDMADGMRLEILAMEITGNNHTVESLKKSAGFKTTVNDFNFSDEYLQKLINYV